MKRSDPVYVDEVWLRWQRRRNLPFRQLDAALDQLWLELQKPLVAVLDRLSRLLNS